MQSEAKGLFNRVFRYAAFLYAAATVVGQCSTPYCGLVLPSDPSVASLSGDIYRNLAGTSMRFEFRWEGANIADGNNHFLLSVGSLQVSVTNGNQLWVSEFYDNVPDNGCLVKNWSGNSHTDVLMRVTRTVSGATGTLTLEVYDTAIGVPSLMSCTVPIAAVAANPRSGFAGSAVALGGPTAVGDIDFLRWYSSILPPGTPIPVIPLGGPADLADYEFQNSTLDSSGNRANFQLSNAAYIDQPLYPPICDAGSQQTFRVGSAASLDGSRSLPLTGGSLIYTWQSVDAPETVSWVSDSSGVAPQFQPGSFGSYTFQLTVTDSNNKSSSCNVKHGAVVTDNNDIVTIPDPNIAKVLSPTVRFGASPWPWFDDRHKTLADLFGSLQQSDYADVWDTPLTGTISITKNSPIVKGAGTSFLHDVCGGGQTTDGMIVIWYPVGDGSFGHLPMGVNSCDSDTQITLSGPYQFGDSADGLSYSAMTNFQVYTWINTSGNANYYDNVVAFYSLYYRSGIDTYLQYARTLADRWWTMPFIDQGRTCDLSGIGTCLHARQRSFTGLVLRALDGRPDMWPGLRKWWDSDRWGITHGSLYDTREQGYQLADVALCALFDPDSDHAQLCAKDALSSLANLWGPNEQSRGYWMNPSFGYATWNGQPGTITATNGSNIIQGAGTNWTASIFPQGNAFWVTNNPGDNSHGDPVSYSATFVDATHISLDRPYEGPSGSGRGWQSNNLVGLGTQPFMMGIAAYAFYLTYLGTGDSGARQMVIDSAFWIAQNGYRPLTRGLYYGLYFVNCTPIRENLPNCSDDNAEGARFYSGEAINAISRAYILTGDPNLLAMGDNLFGAMFGKPGFGGPQSDGIYLTELDSNGAAILNKKAKDFGFFFGIGQNWSWAAARLLGQSAATPALRPLPRAKEALKKANAAKK